MTDIDSAGLTGTDTSLIIVDDDKAFLQRLARAMETRGFIVETADTRRRRHAQGRSAKPPAYAVVDMRLEDGNGLDVIELIRRKRPESRMVVLTGYGNIATAVTAVKLGAVDYLAKPADADEVFLAPDARAGREGGARPTIRCRRIACAGSISSASTSSASATSRKPPAASICTAARCSASSPSAPR